MFTNEKYNENIERLTTIKKPVVQKNSIKEGKLIKNIRKSAIVKKLLNFWKEDKSQYPTAFKKIRMISKGGKLCLLEITDLTKKQQGVNDDLLILEEQ